MTDLPVVGIDLGTTHTTLALCQQQALRAPEVVPNLQVIAPFRTQRRELLPSFVYFAHQGEQGLGLPWDISRSMAVGEYAQQRGLELPGRVVSSAKSWLSCTGIDRRGNLLPLNADEDVERISPVEASFRILDHLVESFAHLHPQAPPLTEHEVVLTVPASFDAAARDLTVEAALAAGLDRITLLEEPQAALYAWLAHHHDDFARLLAPQDLLLVVDVGGGTTDFSAIAVGEAEGRLELRRVAVGEHILLGGDNMDLALAHHLKGKLEATGAAIDRWQLASLAFAARDAKQALLSPPGPERVPVVVAGRGSQLLGNTLRTELVRDTLEELLLSGFFPEVAIDAQPVRRARSGLTQLGLTYAADPAVTRHLAAFLTRQVGALTTKQGTFLHPTAVLFNGGVFKSPLFRERLLSTLNAWLAKDGAPPARLLPGEDLDLAVAQGAAYYGQVKKGRGLRIRGGTARSYYVGIESPVPAVPGVEAPVTALCLAPFGMEEGTEAALPEETLAVVVGEPVSFRFFASSVRRNDVPGNKLESWSPEELSELAPIELTLDSKERTQGELIPVRLRAGVTSVGTLELLALPVEPRLPDEQWRIELNVRASEGIENR